MHGKFAILTVNFKLTIVLVNLKAMLNWEDCFFPLSQLLTHCGRVTQIFVFNTVNLGTSASSP